jgi:hypothetical protein
VKLPRSCLLTMNEVKLFIDDEDDLVFTKVERFVKSNKWNESTWAKSLGVFLTCKTLDVCSRMSETAAVDYIELKEAWLKSTT